MNLFQVLGGLTREEEQDIRNEAAATFPDVVMTEYGGINTTYSPSGQRMDYHGMPVDKYSVNELESAMAASASRSQIREDIFNKVLEETGNLSMAADAAAAADFAPVVGTAIGLQDANIARQEIMPYIDEGDYKSAGIEALNTAAGYGQAALSAVPVAGGLLKTGNRVMPETMADAVGLGRSIMRGDLEGISDTFTLSRPSQPLSAASNKKLGGVLGHLMNEYVQKHNKATLDPAGLGKAKLPDFADKIPATTVARGDYQPKQVITIEDLEGKTIIPAYGDRTYGNSLLTHIGDVELTQPVVMQGGHDFMRNNRTGLWASEHDAMSTKLKHINEVIARGDDPYLVYTAMAGQSGDFSHHMSDAMMGLIEQSPITKKAASEYDKVIKETVDPNWVGIKNPNARQYMMQNMTGSDRRLLWQEMDKDKYHKQGFPFVGAVRSAITDPALINAPTFNAGLSIGRADGGSLLDLSTARQNLGGAERHGSYGAQIEGDYVGGLEEQVPANILFRDFFDARRAAGKATGTDGRSFMMSKIDQKVDAQMVDQVMSLLEYLRSIR